MRAARPGPLGATGVSGLREWRVFGIVAYALFMDYFVYGLVVPLAPYSPAGAVSEDRLALLYGAYAVGVLLATPLFGHLGERIGYRRPMVVGVTLSGVATLLFWLAPSYELLLAARLFQGASAAATWTIGLALVAEHYVKDRIRMMGLALVASTAGSIVGPSLGGLLHDLGGYDLPMAVTAGLVAVDFALRAFLLTTSHVGPGARVDLRALLLDRSILVPALAVALAAFGWGTVEPLLPAHLERHEAGAGTVGLLFTISTIAYGLCAPLVAWASERLAVRWVVLGGVVGMAACLAALSQASGVVPTAIGLCLLSAAFAFALNPTSAELGNAVDRRGLACYAAVYAVYNIAYSVGMMATNALVTAAATWVSFEAILLWAGAALLACAPALLLVGHQAQTKRA